MAVGKNNGKSKVLKKGYKKKKTVNPFTFKDWYDVRAPYMFKNRNIGTTPVTRSLGYKLASDTLKGRVFEVSLAELQSDPDRSYRKFSFIAEDVHERQVLTNFHGMEITTDKLSSMVKKWQKLVEARHDVRTTDGYQLRLFCTGFTFKDPMCLKKTCYGTAQQRKDIRRRMTEIMQREVASCDLAQVIYKFIPDSIAKDIRSACNSIYPLHNVYIRKVKVVDRPRFDIGRLMDLHFEARKNTLSCLYKSEIGEVVNRPGE